jgi:hypothetical protein
VTVTTAFVLSGGGSLGAVQVGMLQVLAERDVRPDLLIGTSAGAINAALSQAVALGADDIYVLPAGFACALQQPPTSAVATAVQALTLLIEQ